MNVNPRTKQEYVDAIKQRLTEASPKQAIRQMEKIKLPPNGSVISQLIQQAVPSLEWEVENTHDSLTGQELDKALRKDAEAALSKIKSYVKDFENGIRYQKEYRLAAVYGWLKDNDYQYTVHYHAIAAMTEVEASKQLASWRTGVSKHISEGGKEWELELVKAQMQVVDNRGNVICGWVTMETE